MSPNDATAPGCAECHLSHAQLQARAKTWWECSHVSCPQRKALTAAPPRADAFAAEGAGCWRIKPVFRED